LNAFKDKIDLKAKPSQAKPSQAKAISATRFGAFDSGPIGYLPLVSEFEAVQPAPSRSQAPPDSALNQVTQAVHERFANQAADKTHSSG
jgi:hypothetical protein